MTNIEITLVICTIIIVANLGYIANRISEGFTALEFERKITNLLLEILSRK